MAPFFNSQKYNREKKGAFYFDISCGTGYKESIRAISSEDRALVSGTKGRGFKSHIALQ